MQINNLMNIIMPKIIRMVGIGFMALLTCVQSMESAGNKIPHEIAREIPEEIRIPAENYYRDLPSLCACLGDSSEDKAAAIVEMLLKMAPQRNKTFNLVGTLSGQADLTEKIKGLLDNNSVVTMITVGFPFKSSNHELKVINEHIDMGEFFGLLTYEHICQEIKKIHHRGAQLIVYPDGCVYRELDLFNSCNAYQQNLKKLTEIFPSVTLGDAPKKGKINSQPLYPIDAETKKDIGYFMLTELHCAVWKKLLLKSCIQTVGIKGCEKNKNGTIKIFMEINDQELSFNVPGDKIALLVGIEDIDELIYKCLDDSFKMTFDKSIMREINPILNEEIERRCEELSYLAVVSSKKFANAIRYERVDYDQCVRLSIHPHSNIVEKCSIGPIYGSKGSPWHGCPILGNHGITVMPKLELLKMLGKNQDHTQFLKVTEINGIPLKYYAFDLK